MADAMRAQDGSSVSASRNPSARRGSRTTLGTQRRHNAFPSASASSACNRLATATDGSRSRTTTAARSRGTERSELPRSQREPVISATLGLEHGDITLRVSERATAPAGPAASLTASTAVSRTRRGEHLSGAHAGNRRLSRGGRGIPAAALSILTEGVQRNGPSAGSKHMLRAEAEAAEEAIATGIYVVWRNEHVAEKTKNGKAYHTDNGLEISDYHECFRVAPSSRCFCGHDYKEHHLPVERKAPQPTRQRPAGSLVPRFPPPCSACPCSEYRFIPDHPDAIAESWLSRRPGFDASNWAAKCKCKHTHLTHDVKSPHRCKEKGCGCSGYASAWECLICDGKWQDHETIVETSAERCAANRAVGPDFRPLSEMPDLQELVFSKVRPATRDAFHLKRTREYSGIGDETTFP